MRQLALILSIVLICIKTSGQAIVGNSYVIITDAVTVYGITDNGEIDSIHNFKAGLRSKFIVNGFDKNNNIKIAFWKFASDLSTNHNLRHSQDSSGINNRREIVTGKNALTKEEARNYNNNLEYISSWANFKEFVIPLTTFNSACKLYYGKKNNFNWGVMTLPLKVRFGNNKGNYFDFEEKLNLGFVFGLRHQLQGKIEQSLNYLAGVGVTAVKADSLSLKSGKNLTSPSATAFSINAGVLYQYETFQIGLFFGADFIPETLGRDWKHQGRPWLGVAVGVSLFSRNSSQGGSGENK